MTRRLRWLMMATLACALSACGEDAAPPTGNGGGGGGTTQVSGDIVIPPSWAGSWEITLTYSDCTSGAIQYEEVYTSQLCTGDTLVNPFSPVLSNCTGTITGTRFDVDCSYQGQAGACQATVDFDLSFDRSGAQLSGSGHFETTMTPGCGNVFSPGCYDIAVSGMLLDPSTAPCAPQPRRRNSFLR